MFKKLSRKNEAERHSSLSYSVFSIFVFFSSSSDVCVFGGEGETLFTVERERERVSFLKLH